jgi:CheY-like chemotaxis protein
MNYLLVVDDSPLDRQLAKGLLERQFNHRIEFAATGWEALEHIEAHLPLAVITDLQMPEMDGMQLTETVRQRFPSAPVILMTAHGSETIALDALLRGATDYVPKAKLAAELNRAVEAVLSVTAEVSREHRLQNCLRFEQTLYELENDSMLIPPLVDHLQQVAREMNLVDDSDRLRLAKALLEAVSNAMYHGNLELSSAEASTSRPSPDCSELIRQRRQQAPFCDRRVTVKATVSPNEGRFVVRDQGPGFDTRSVPNITADPSHLAHSERRGLVLIKLFMDEIRFNEQGNEITLVKYRRLPAERTS